ncbi:MAG: site-specific DNA-methyltransferase, partial [Proteobacteria bacterium]|nr:site-specific DNA-methyltransferase [Pseudomonadota bacterium]
SGSVFVQISDDNVHHIREIADEVFGAKNFLSIIAFTKAAGGLQAANRIGTITDYIAWYAKDSEEVKFRRLFQEKTDAEGDGYTLMGFPGGYYETAKQYSKREKPVEGAKHHMSVLMTKPGPGSRFGVDYCGASYTAGGRWWGTTPDGLARVKKSMRALPTGSSIRLANRFEDFPYGGFQNLWAGLGGAANPVYVVQTNETVTERCLLMTTDPGDLVLDPTCGSGTTAFVAEKWGRRWITCDTSRVAVTLAKQRLATASFDYYEMRYPHEGLKGGFIYKTVPHITLKSIANNPEIDEIYQRMHPAIAAALADLNAAMKGARFRLKAAQGGRKGEWIDFAAAEGETVQLPSGETAPLNAMLEWEVPFDFPDDWPEGARATFDAFHAARQAMQRKMDDSILANAGQETLYDKPQVAKDKLRITGPFTVEAVPSPTVLALDKTRPPDAPDASIARQGETSRQATWRDELLRTGIRGKGGQRLRIAELETVPGLKFIHASGAMAESGERVLVSFGPEHAALEQRQVALALTEAEKLRPAPKFIVFCAFTFDPEAAKDIDEINWPGVTLLKAQMNTDLLTEGLKKKRSTNESFWLMGQPDVDVRKRADGKWEVEVNGFDYFDTKADKLVSGGKGKIAMWMLDPDYDERSLIPRQVFFPMAGAKDGWNRLRKTIRAELDEDLLEAFHGTVSLPFEAGDNARVAVKIVDDRGIESLKIIALD